VLTEDVDAVCDRYFRQCSVLVTSEDLALMAATLANGGRNPRTGERAFSEETVGHMLSVMSTCGMYDFAGAWIFRVGMPAKSGVSGGVLAVLPGQLGIGVFSPRLDAFGNSVRGTAVCEALSREFGLHVLRPPVSPDGAVRSAMLLSGFRSRRVRPAAEAALLDAEGHRVVILQLQGPMVLSTAEVVLRRALDRMSPGDTLVLDFRRAGPLDSGVSGLLAVMGREISDEGGVLAVANVREGTRWAGPLGKDDGEGVRFFATLDEALEWCEDRILEGAQHVAGEMTLAEHPLLARLPGDDLAWMTRHSTRTAFPAGSRLIARGSAPDTVFFVVSGSVEVSIAVGGGRSHRLAALGAGTAVGELALLDASPRSADVDAVTDVVAYTLPATALQEDDPALCGVRLRLIEAVARELADRLRRANAEIEALAG
jgi:glutaminase